MNNKPTRDLSATIIFVFGVICGLSAGLVCPVLWQMLYLAWRLLSVWRL